MKTITKVGLFIACMVIVFASCRKSGSNLVNYIPKDATVVFSVDPKSLHSKMDDAKISLDTVLKPVLDAIREERNDSLFSMETMKNAGVDWKEKIYGFVKTSNSMLLGSSVEAATLLPLDDASKYETFLKEKFKVTEVKKEKDYSFAKIESNVITGWNKGMAVIIVTNEFSYGKSGDSDNAISEQQLANLFGLKKEDAVTSLASFNDMDKKKSDVFLWFGGASSGAAVASGMLGFGKVADLFKDSYLGAHLNFEKGKVVLNYAAFPGKDLGEAFKKNPASSIDLSMIEQCPSENINGFFVSSFNPMVIKDILKILGMDVFAEQMVKKESNLSLDDILKAFKGESCAIAYNLRMDRKPNEFYPGDTINSVESDYVFNTKINDKDAFKKLAGQFVTQGVLVAKGNGYALAQTSKDMDMQADEKNLVLANNTTVLEQYKSSTKKITLPGDMGSKAKGKIFAGYGDIAKFLQNTPSYNVNTKNFYLECSDIFKDVSVTGEKYNGKSLNGEIELRMVNDKENSMAGIARYVKALENMEKARSARFNDIAPSTMDSATTVVPATPVPDVKAK